MKHRLLCIVALLGCLGTGLAEEFVIDLTWQSSGLSQHLRSDRDTHAPFAKEPDAAGQPVFRGTVWLEPQEPAGFLWLKDQSKLYIDLNRDGDLTNDPEGIVSEKQRQGRPDYDHEFEPFSIQRQTEHGTLTYVIDARISNYRPSHFYPNFYLRSGFIGLFERNQKQWEFAVADMPGHLRTQPFLCCLSRPNQRGYHKWWSPPAQLFFGGHNYTLSFQWTQWDDKPLLQAVLTDTPAPMGLLEIPGKEIQALSLQGTNTIVFPEISDQPVPIPAGQYQCRELFLKGKEDFRKIIPNKVDTLTCTVPENGTGQFKAGAPLAQTITVTRAGNSLKFSYKLLGIGGEAYDVRQVTNYDNARKPKVIISKGDLVLASGTFEFG